MRFFHFLLLLVLFYIGGSYAQVYVGSSGNEWNGVCDGSCPQSSPCQFSVSGSTTVTGPCVLHFLSGTAIPAQALSANFAGNVTLSSMGPVSLAADLSVSNGAGGVVFQNFVSSGAHGFSIASSKTFILDSSMTITDYSQISVSQSSSVVIQDSSFSSKGPLLKCAVLAANAKVEISGVNLETIQGVSETVVSTPGDEPSIRIRDSNITGFIFKTSKFADVTLENVMGTLSTSSSIFDVTPTGTITITGSNLTSTSNAWLIAAGSGTGSSVIIVGSHFENVVTRASVSSIRLENSTFTLDELYGPVIDASGLYTVYLGFISINTRTAIGSAPVLSSFTSPSAIDWTSTEFTYSSPSTVPRLRFGGTGWVIHSDIVLPSLNIEGYGMNVYGSNRLTFGGNITITQPYGTIAFQDLPTLTFTSISIAKDLTISCRASTDIRYHVTKPKHGIQCLESQDCLIRPAPLPTTPRPITWDSSLPLPIPGEQYPYWISLTTVVDTFSSPSGEFTITSTNSNSVSYFSFEKVPCPANCIPANSFNCTSTVRCTCREGYEGVNCEIPPLDSHPAEISPFSSPTGTSPIYIPQAVPQELIPENPPVMSVPPRTAPPHITLTPLVLTVVPFLPDKPYGTPPPTENPSPPTENPSPPTENPSSPPSVNPPSNPPPLNSPVQSPSAIPESTATSSAPGQLSRWGVSVGLTIILICGFC